MKRRSKNNCSGFTLIEVLVALAIIAIALGALLSTSGSQASNVGYLKQKTIAHWVAMNEMTRLNIEKKFPDLGTSDGSSEMTNTDWYWTREVLETGNPDTREVRYTLYADSSREQNLTRLIGYVTRIE